MTLEKARNLLKAHFPVWDSDVANLAYEIVAESCDRVVDLNDQDDPIAVKVRDLKQRKRGIQGIA